jgi:nitroreductase
MTTDSMSTAPARLTRRGLLLAATATTVATTGCDGRTDDYAAAVAETWRDTPAGGALNRDQIEREIVRFATLSPSHRNRQPWRFALGPGWIDLRPDPDRRLPVADPDDHHLHVSLGAALETMVVSAAAAGLDATVEPRADGIRVNYQTGLPSGMALYQAILARQTARVPFDPTPLPTELLDRCQALANQAGTVANVLTDRESIDLILELTLTAVERQLRDERWLAEFQDGLRLTADEALAQRDGVYTSAWGYPAVPRFIASRFFEMVTTPARERKRCTEQLRGCGALVVIGSPDASPADRYNAGRAYQRLALVTTAAGVRSAPLNPALDYPDLRKRLADVAALGTNRPAMVLRLGTGGPPQPRALRRAATDVTTGTGQ